MPKSLSWIEIDTTAIKHNINIFINLLPEHIKIMSVIKGNAYGHGMITIAKTALKAGADWLGVFNLCEAALLRAEEIKAPIMILGYVAINDLKEAVLLETRITVSSLETIDALLEITRAVQKKAYIHFKLETGTNRLGFDDVLLEKALEKIKSNKWLVLEGAHTHFANIEDTTEHGYARGQLEKFKQMLDNIRKHGFEVPLPHAACSAASILFPETYFSMIRLGISMYGMWPSKETFLSALEKGKDTISFKPAFTWKTRIAQIKSIPAGSFIGYGCTYKTTRKTSLAILPIGYSNGYNRLLSNHGYVLIKGKRAPICGRVCMNLTMVDVTDIPDIKLEDEVVLLGTQGSECITAELMAGWAQTINYEITTCADPFAERIYY
jgi:alanine racemase